MKSVSKTITTDWTQIASGTDTVDLQVKGRGTILIAIDEAEPVSYLGSFSSSGTVKIFPPLSAWARTGNSNGQPVIVTITE